MNERRTASILQRVPVILAVTAASYGLPVKARSKPHEGGCAASRTQQPQSDVQRA